MRFNIHGLAFTVFLAGLSALPPLAIDMALPSLALVQADLHASQTQAASAIAIFLAGFATAPLAVGPLSDRFGRKPIMLAGLLLFTLCALGCALSPSIGALLAFRLFQGVGAGSVGILPRAIIRDLFEGRESRLHIAAVSLVFSIAPLIAPSIGAAILTAGPWRLIYVVLTAVGAVLARLDQWEQETDLPRSAIQALKRFHAERKSNFASGADVAMSGVPANDVAALSLELIDVERNAISDAYEENRITDDARRRSEREFDLEEASIRHGANDDFD